MKITKEKINAFVFRNAFPILWIVFVIYDLLLEYNFWYAMIFVAISFLLLMGRYGNGLSDALIKEYSDGLNKGQEIVFDRLQEVSKILDSAEREKNISSKK